MIDCRRCERLGVGREVENWCIRAHQLAGIPAAGLGAQRKFSAGLQPFAVSR